MAEDPQAVARIEQRAGSCMEVRERGIRSECRAERQHYANLYSLVDCREHVLPSSGRVFDLEASCSVLCSRWYADTQPVQKTVLSEQ